MFTFARRWTLQEYFLVSELCSPLENDVYCRGGDFWNSSAAWTISFVLSAVYDQQRERPVSRWGGVELNPCRTYDSLHGNSGTSHIVLYHPLQAPTIFIVNLPDTINTIKLIKSTQPYTIHAYSMFINSSVKGCPLPRSEAVTYR